MIYILTYRVPRPVPIFLICPFFTILPKTVSTVVALTSGRILQMSDFEIGVGEFIAVAHSGSFQEDRGRKRLHQSSNTSRFHASARILHPHRRPHTIYIRIHSLYTIHTNCLQG